MCSPATANLGPACLEQAISQPRQQLELADVFRAHAEWRRFNPDQARVARAIVNCRTAVLGGHRWSCDNCGYEVSLFNSCRNRHCPKCLGQRAVRWLADRRRDLLPVPYFHVVFTIPRDLHGFFRRDPRAGYGVLMRAAAATLKEVAARPENLGAKIGFTTVLHTWTQQLRFHPHVHCVVTGGGLDTTGTRWVTLRSKGSGAAFFVPIGKLKSVFVGKLLSGLEEAVTDGNLVAPPRWKRLLVRASRRKWVVYAKAPFGGPEQVLKYLSLYTHRVAISNTRLIAMDPAGKVTFWWRDRRDGDRKKKLTLSGAELVRRFLQHVLPSRFQRIRHYGLLASSAKKKLLPLVRDLLGAEPLTSSPVEEETASDEGPEPRRCPRCKERTLVMIDELTRQPIALPWDQRGPP